MDILDLEHAQLAIGFHDRMMKLALFDPLFELRAKRRMDREGQPVDLMELGMLTLLYFFEQKLQRNSRAGAKELTCYLQTFTNGTYSCTEEEMNELARTIIQVFRPASGKKREFEYFNWETRQQDRAHISILKAHAFDLKTNTQYYTLDEDGLELVFATKEFYSEFQLSIHQLVLRKQLEKGEFQGALRQINEMMVDVESLRERMVKIEHEIKRNIVSEETFGRYKSLLEDIYSRLHRENEEFEELRQFVKETKDRIHAESARKKDQRPYELILRIANELENVHSEHTALFRQSMEMKGKALAAAKESLYFTGLHAFNFEQDITSHIFGTPLPLESMKGILAPFLQIEQMQQWSLLTVWAGQNIQEESSGTAGENGFMEAEEDQRLDAYTEQKSESFRTYMTFLIQRLNEDGHVDLASMIQQINASGDESWLDRRSFYDFWFVLHQRSPLKGTLQDGSASDDNKNQWLESIFQQLGTRTLIVMETTDILRVTKRFAIQNMVFGWGEADYGG